MRIKISKRLEYIFYHYSAASLALEKYAVGRVAAAFFKLLSVFFSIHQYYVKISSFKFLLEACKTFKNVFQLAV